MDRKGKPFKPGAYAQEHIGECTAPGEAE
jgi:hypothetical protein